MTKANGLPNKKPGRPPKTHQEDPILSIPEVGRQLGKSPSTINRWCLDGLLKHLRMPNGMLGVRKSQVNKILAASEIDGKVS